MIELVGGTCSTPWRKSAIRLAPFVLPTRAMRMGAIPQGFRRRSLEVVHDQRPPTPFHAQNRQFQPATTTANDT